MTIKQIFIVCLSLLGVFVPKRVICQARITHYYDSLTWYRGIPPVDSAAQVFALDLSRSKLRVLPDSIMALTNVRAINLSWCQMLDLESALVLLSKLPHLEGLALEDNELVKCPRGLRLLTSLKWLSLNNNRIRRVDPSIFRLTQLRVLVLGYRGQWLDFGNRIKAWRSHKTFPDLIELYLASNQLRKVPHFILGQNKLEILSLTGNRLKRVPEDLAAMERLRLLYISFNKIRQMPVSILKRFEERQLYY